MPIALDLIQASGRAIGMSGATVSYHAREFRLFCEKTDAQIDIILGYPLAQSPPPPRSSFELRYVNKIFRNFGELHISFVPENCAFTVKDCNNIFAFPTPPNHPY